MRIGCELLCWIKAKIFNSREQNIDIANQGHLFYYKCSHSKLIHYDSSFDHHDRQAHKARNTTDSLTTPMGNVDFFFLATDFWLFWGFWPMWQRVVVLALQDSPASSYFTLISMYRWGLQAPTILNHHRLKSGLYHLITIKETLVNYLAVCIIC